MKEFELTVIRLQESGVIAADADTAWQVLRDFTSAARWAGEIVSCVMEGGAGVSEVGAIRRMTFDTGAVARERLLALSDRERFFEYELLPPEELPFEGYLGKLQVLPLSGGRSVVIWSSSLTATGGNPGEAGEFLSRAYQAGIAALGAHLSRE